MPDLHVSPSSAQRDRANTAAERPGHPRKIGILGGMGPLATADLYRKLILATPATRDQEHLPVVIDADPRVPDRTSALRGEGADPLPTLVAGATRLHDAGADLGLIVCNTAHAFLPALGERVPLEFLDMIAETVARVATDFPTVRRVGLLATRGTIEARLYHQAIAGRHIELFTLDGDAQGELVDGAVALVKAGTPRARAGRAPRRSGAAPGRCRGGGGGGRLYRDPLVLTPGAIPVPLLDPTQIQAEAAVRAARDGPA